ncbi:MAG TPA: response regulator [Gemmataceae bacterium]
MELTRNNVCTEPNRATTGKYGILVADDEEGVRGVLAIGMRQHGFDVWLAADGQQALDLYRRHGESIDVVLLDVRMPGRDGPQTLAALQQLNPRVRCCFMSGDFDCYNEEGRCYTEERLRDMGAAAVIPKPFRLDQIGQMLCQLVSKADLSPSIL